MRLLPALLACCALGPASGFAPQARVVSARRVPATTAARRAASKTPDPPPAPAWPASNRVAVAALGLAGFCETGYLTYSKLFAPTAAICGSAGCSEVLGSPWGAIPGLDLPLTLPAMFAYLLVAALALAPLAQRSAEAALRWDRKTRAPLLALGTSLAAFSSYLMWVLAFRIGAPCPWCFASAALSFSIAAVSWLGGLVPERRRALAVGAASGGATLVVALGLFAATELTTAFVGTELAAASAADAAGPPFAPPPVTTVTTKRAARLAAHLKKLDARMFGAYWCSHCFDQKAAFGAEGAKSVNYIECASDGAQSQAKLCRERHVPGYPTWEIGGKLYPGEKSLEDLEKLVGLASGEPSK